MDHDVAPVARGSRAAVQRARSEARRLEKAPAFPTFPAPSGLPPSVLFPWSVPFRVPCPYGLGRAVLSVTSWLSVVASMQCESQCPFGFGMGLLPGRPNVDQKFRPYCRPEFGLTSLVMGLHAEIPCALTVDQM